MAQVTSPGEVIRFGTFELNVSMGELRERGVRLSIQGLPLQILAYPCWQARDPGYERRVTHTSVAR